MVKKYRDITVNNIIYGYVIKSTDEGNNISIWRNRKIIKTMHVNGNIEITPKYISQLIENQQNEQEKESGYGRSKRRNKAG